MKRERFYSNWLRPSLPALLHEIHHTDARDFKESLKREYGLAEGLKAKIEGLRRYES